MAPLHIFNPPEPAGNPEYSAGAWFAKQGGLCGKCQSCPHQWKLTVELAPGPGIPEAYSGSHILTRRIPEPANPDAFCVWLSPPSDALADEGFGEQLRGASLWRLAFNAPGPPASASPYWWEGKWSIHAGAFYYSKTVGNDPFEIAGGQLDTDVEEVGGFASYIRLDYETRPFRCLHPNPFQLVEQVSTTTQFPADLIIEPWWA